MKLLLYTDTAVSPIRTPLVTNGLSGSFGIVFLFTNNFSLLAFSPPKVSFLSTYILIYIYLEKLYI